MTYTHRVQACSLNIAYHASDSRRIDVLTEDLRRDDVSERFPSAETIG